MKLNAAIRECVADLNAKIMRRLGKSRRRVLETLDRPALKALPAEQYRYAEWKRARVAPDYHIEIAGQYTLYLRGSSARLSRLEFAQERLGDLVGLDEALVLGVAKIHDFAERERRDRQTQPGPKQRSSLAFPMRAADRCSASTHVRRNPP